MIPCPLCGAKTRVIETRVTATSARRRRVCKAVACSGKVTTVEIVVPDRGASLLAAGSIVVSAKQIAQLRKIVDAIEGGAL